MAGLLEGTAMPGRYGAHSAETMALKKEIAALTRMARETMAAIE